jgi:hypothetical protein
LDDLNRRVVGEEAKLLGHRARFAQRWRRGGLIARFGGRIGRGDRLASTALDYAALPVDVFRFDFRAAGSARQY